MSRYAQRLSRVARALGCPIHGERLSCPACEVPDPLPEPLTTSAGDFIQAILTRVGPEGIRAGYQRVGPAAALWAMSPLWRSTRLLDLQGTPHQSLAEYDSVDG
jgi:hypothetical protein